MIIFYYGTDAWRMRQQAEAMKERYRAKYSSGMNLLSYDFADHAVHELRDAIKNVSFFHEVRLCVVTNCFAKDETAEQLSSIIHDYDIVSSKENVLMVLERAAGSMLLKEHKALFTLLTQLKVAHNEFAPLRGATLERWIVEECAHYDRTISPSTTRLLIERVGSDSWSLSNEVAKLAHFCRTIITPEAIHALVSVPVNENVFALTDALAENNRPKAAALLYQQLAAGADPQAIFGAIVYQIRTLCAAHSAKTKGAAALAKALGVHPFAAQKALHHTSHHTATKLTRAYQELAAIDLRTKRGATTLEDELYRWIIMPDLALQLS